MTTILYIAEIILYTILAINIGYLLLFALASKFYRRRNYPNTPKHNKFAVLFPAYKEDKVILPTIQSFLQQDYPAEFYDIIVISDQMQESTNEALRQLPIRLLTADYTDSSKAKAMNLAMKATADTPYDMIVIMDADNTTDPDFLSEINRAFQAGEKAIQAHRTAKNMNTDVAVLDAASEEINNHLFRKAHTALGFSSALIGSGMMFDFEMFQEIAPRLSGSDLAKAAEMELLKENIYTEYMEEIVCYCKKTDDTSGYSKERQRWLGSKYRSSILALQQFPIAFLQGKWDLCEKLFQWLLPSRFLLILYITICAVAMTFLEWPLATKWYALLAILFITFLMAMPEGEISRKFRSAFWSLPILVVTSSMSHITRIFKRKKKRKAAK